MHEYWDSLLKACENRRYLPFSYAEEEAGMAEYRFDASESEEIRRFCKGISIHESELFFLAFALTLGYLKNQADVIFYVSAPEIYETGFPVRCCLEERPVAELIEAMHQQMKHSSAESFYQYAMDAPEILSDCVIDFQLVYTASGQQQMIPEFVTEHTVFCENRGDTILLTARMNGTAYEKQHILRIFAKLIRQCLTVPHLSPLQLEAEEDAEISRILQVYNHPLPEAYPDYLKEHLFAHTGETHTAVIFRKERLTYEQLYQKTEAVCRKLESRGYRRCAVVMQKSIEMPVIILSMIRLGICYIPIDSQLPAERIRSVLELTAPDALIVQKDCQDVLDLQGYQQAELTGMLLLCEPSAKPNHDNCDISEMCILFTSGTTGIPKGVRLRYRNVNAYIHSFLQEFRLTEKSVVLQQATFGFDTFIEEFFPVLTAGGTAVMADRGMVLDFPELCRYLKENAVDTVSCSPLMVNELNRYLSDSSVTCVISGGDVLKPQYYDRLRETMRIYNTYGPTETTVCATYHDTARIVPVSGQGSCIGRPVSDAGIYIMRGGHLCGTYIAGEILIGGDGVTAGYDRAEEITNSRFTKNPFAEGMLYHTGDIGMWLEDGSIQFLGRNDRQIKLHSFRIELSEIEQAVRSHFPMNEIEAVFFRDIEKLALFYASDEEIPADAVRTVIRRKLPAYMMPAYLVQLSALPRNINDKLDLRALRKKISHEQRT